MERLVKKLTEMSLLDDQLLRYSSSAVSLAVLRCARVLSELSPANTAAMSAVLDCNSREVQLAQERLLQEYILASEVS